MAFPSPCLITLVTSRSSVPKGNSDNLDDNQKETFDIVIKMGGGYYYDDKKGKSKEYSEKYFNGKISIKDKGKKYAELDLEKFAQHCIELNDRMAQGG